MYFNSWRKYVRCIFCLRRNLVVRTRRRRRLLESIRSYWSVWRRRTRLEFVWCWSCIRRRVSSRSGCEVSVIFFREINRFGGISELWGVSVVEDGSAGGIYFLAFIFYFFVSRLFESVSLCSAMGTFILLL